MAIVNWGQDWTKAIQQAAETGKAVFVDFHNPECIGCQTMDADTYPHSAVADFLNQSGLVIPLRVRYDAEPQSGTYQVTWTPNLMVLDAEGKVQQHVIGFQSAAELVPWIMLGAAKARFHAHDWLGVRKILDQVITQNAGNSSAAEAMFYQAVASFRQDDDPSHLKAAHHKIAKAFPHSIWVQRTYPYTKL